MLTRIDHVMICVRDLDRAVEAYTRIGFDVHAGGVHPGRGTKNAIAFNEADYLELLALRDPAATAATPGPRPGCSRSWSAATASGTWPCRATTSPPTWRPCAGAAWT